MFGAEQSWKAFWSAVGLPHYAVYPLDSVLNHNPKTNPSVHHNVWWGNMNYLLHWGLTVHFFFLFQKLHKTWVFFPTDGWNSNIATKLQYRGWTDLSMMRPDEKNWRWELRTQRAEIRSAMLWRQRLDPPCCDVKVVFLSSAAMDSSG